MRELTWRADAIYARQADLAAWGAFWQPWFAAPDYETMHPILCEQKRERDDSFPEREAAYRASLPQEVTPEQADQDWLDFQAAMNGA